MIDLIPDNEEQQLIDAARSFLAAEMGREQLRELIRKGDPFDRGFLRQCGELGWFGLTLDESAGGVGLSVVAEALVFRELGRFLVPGPIMATALAASVAVLAGETELAGPLVAGELIAGLAEVGQGDEGLVIWDPTGVDLVLVLDRSSGTVGLIDSDVMDPGDPVASIDPLIWFAEVDPSLLPPYRCQVTGPDAFAFINRGRVLCSAFLVGIAEQVRDDAAAYAKNRVQFGKAIGAFQAVKHRSADMAVRAEAAWAQTLVAALRLRMVGNEAEFDVVAAKILAADAAIRNARDNIQNHGGIGFTAEHDAHLFLKRAHVLEQVLGTRRELALAALVTKIGW